jgi:methionine-rich copper-binding protein CopC
VNGFNGMNFLDSVNGYVPPDTDMAVGPNYVIETVNAQIQIYDKATGTALLPNTPLNQFFGAPSESPFDPVVTYNDIAGRFVVAAPTFGNHLLFAVSKTSNPFDGFKTYDLDVSEGGQSPDYPKIGWNADEVVISLNMYNGDGHVQILAFDTGKIFASTPPSTLTEGSDYFSNDRGSGFSDFTMAAASMHGATPGMPMYFVEENGYANGNSMRVISAGNLLSHSPSYTDTVVGVDSYSQPPAAQQPGGYVETNDSRILNAEWRDGLLVADQNIGMYWQDNNAHARWYEFNVTGSPYLVQDGTISPGPDTSTYFPAITIAPGDIIGMVYNESSPTEYPSAYDTGRSASDPYGTMQTPVLAVAGTATYSDFAFRWGDYSGIGVDPTDGSIWTGAEYATSALVGDPANWATYISHFTIAPVVISSSPAAGSVVTGTPPSTFSITFSEPMDPGSVNAADFKVDGTPASSAQVSADDLTITYTFNSSPVVAQGAETMALPAGAVRGQSGTGNAAFSATFYYVTTQLQVSATSPAVGSVLAAPVTDLVVQFNKDINPYSVSSSDFQVSQGSVAAVHVLTPQAVDLTLSGVTQDGTLVVTLPAWAILDTYGVGNLAFSGTYSVDITSAPYPTPLEGKTPAGGLIYDPSVNGQISFVGDTDTYTLPLAANQELSLVLTTDPSLIGTVTVLDPGGHTIASATGSGPGKTVVLQSVPVATAGTYSLVVSGSGGTTGNYTLRAVLNAVVKQASDPINSLNSAYDLSSAFAGLGTTPSADRAGVLGTLGAADLPVAAFPMNEPNWSGPAPQVLDSTGDGHDGTAVGGANTVADTTFGQVGSFDGNGQYVSVGGSYPMQGARTITAWVDPQANSLSLGEPIITGGLPGQGDFFGIAGTGGENSGVPQYSLYVDHWGTQAYASSVRITPGQWNFVAMTYDGVKTVSFFVNGQPAGSVTSNGLYNYDINTYDLAGNTIGGTTTEGSFDGLLRGVGIYNSALSAAQIQSLYTQPDAATTKPTDYYKFWLNAGQSASLVATGQNGGQASLGLFDGSGNLLALPNGASLIGPINLGSGFASAGSTITTNGNAYINGSNLELTDGYWGEAGSAFSSQKLYVGNFTTSFNFQLLPSFTNPIADGITFTIQGASKNALGYSGDGLGYQSITPSVAIKFDLFDPSSWTSVSQTGIYTDGAAPDYPAIDLAGQGLDLHSGDPFNVTMNYDGSTLNVTIKDTITNVSASQSYSVDIPGILGGTTGYVGFTGGTGSYNAIQNIQNWTFTPGQDLITAAKQESINNFVATTSGWYYAEVGGQPSTSYSLVVTRGADLSRHAGSFDKAQPLDGTSVVLGAITKGGAALQALDMQSFAYNQIYQTDPTTGAFGSSITSPNNDGYFLFGQNMASDGTYTYYNDGYGGTGNIYKLDSTGAIVAQTTGPNSYSYTGIAFLGGKLYANAAFDSHIYIYDADTLAFEGTISTGSGAAWTGLAGDPDRGVLWAVAQVSGSNGKLYEIDPATGNILKQAADNAQGYFEQDLAYANGDLIVSVTNGSYGAGNNFLDEYNPDTLGFLQRVAPPYTYAAAGLAGDGVTGGSDWFQFNVNAGDNLVLTTTTPGGGPGSGKQFMNDLMPTLNLYDANGNLVASATGNAGDGRNDVIDWTALSSGSYRVQILGSSKDNLGEYTIAIQGATGGQYPFHVTSTSPAAGSDLNHQVSTMTVVVDQSTLLTSVSPSDFTIDGASATGVTVVDNHTFVFSFATTVDGVHSVSISGLVDIHGVTITPDNFTFKTDTVPPYIVSSSIADGSVFGPAPANVTEVVTFSEPMNTSLTPTIQLYGEIRNVYYTASESWDPTGTVLTIGYANLPSDAYQFNLYAYGFQDLAGNTLTSGLTTNFTVVGGTSTFPGLTPVLPLGSLVYQGTADNVLVTGADVDTYNLAIDPNQTIGVVATPVSSGMSVTVELISPAGKIIGFASSPSPGQPAVLPGVQSSKGGTYQIKVMGGPGEYHVTATLNAYLDPAAYGLSQNGSIASATPIDPYANKFIGQNDRMAVLGTVTGGPRAPATS